MKETSLQDLDRRSVLHPVTSVDEQQRLGPRVFAAASGCRVTDINGREFLDLGAGLWCVNVGYGREALADVARAATKDLSYFYSFGAAANVPMIQLADHVLRLLAHDAGIADLARVFFGCSGSDANDTAYKLVKYYNNVQGRPRKKKIVSRLGAYHGSSFASGSLTGIGSYHAAFDQPLPDVLHVSCPHHYRFARDGESPEQFGRRLVDELSALIEREGAETVAAFIAEPIMGTGGVLLPPPGYFEGVSELLRRHDILLIVDEVITGFGRTGRWFGSELYGLQPDILSFAKGLTSGYFPLSATVISERVWQVLRDASPTMGTFMHGFTYTGHPVGCAIALANLDIVEREGLVHRAAEMGDYLLRGLRERLADSPFVGDIRGEGLLAAVELVADRTTRRFFRNGQGPHQVVARQATANGLLVRALPFIDVNSFSPPFTISRAEIDEGVERYGRALDEARPALERLASAA
jgi:L-2,4-diaminobutyrate transaminase